MNKKSADFWLSTLFISLKSLNRSCSTSLVSSIFERKTQILDRKSLRQHSMNLACFHFTISLICDLAVLPSSFYFCNGPTTLAWEYCQRDQAHSCHWCKALSGSDSPWLPQTTQTVSTYVKKPNSFSFPQLRKHPNKPSSLKYWLTPTRCKTFFSKNKSFNFKRQEVKLSQG